MALEKLSSEAQAIILSCLNAISKGPFIENSSELYSRLGVNRSILDRMIKMWPDIDDSGDDSDEEVAINNAMNEVCYGIKFSEKDWHTWFSVDRETVRNVFEQWRKLKHDSINLKN